MYKIKLNTELRRRRLKRFSSESGEVRLKVVIWLVLIGLVAYGGYMVVPQYVSYKLLQYEVEGEAKVAHMYSNADITERLLDKAKSWSVDIIESDIEIVRSTANIEIAISYGVNIYFFGRYEKTFFYDIYVIEPIKRHYGR
jgi:hypothetical protein